MRRFLIRWRENRNARRNDKLEQAKHEYEEWLTSLAGKKFAAKYGYEEWEAFIERE
jgi:hypothetical protein